MCSVLLAGNADRELMGAQLHAMQSNSVEPVKSETR